MIKMMKLAKLVKLNAFSPSETIHQAKRFTKQNDSPGFTLLETIVAFALLLAAVMGPITLITKGFFGFLTSKNKVVALQLAQEGLELIQVIRENNILCQAAGTGTSWRQDFDGAAGSSLIGNDRSIDATNPFPRTCVGTDTTITVQNPTMSSLECPTTNLRIDSNGRYGYLSGAPTVFTRCLDISAPASGEGEFPFIIGTANMMDVIVRVEWQERTNTKNIELRKRFYNWR